MKKYEEVNVKNLKKEGFQIKKINLPNYIDDYRGKRHFGTAIVIMKENEIYKAYENRSDMYKDMKRARRRLLDLFEWLYI